MSLMISRMAETSSNSQADPLPPFTRILSQNKGKNVWSRLSYDAAIRQTSKSRALRPTPAEASIFYAGNDLTKRPQTSDSYISGFVTNTYPVVFNRDLTFRSGHLKVPGDVSLDTATNEQLKKMKTKAPIEFFSVVRPDCETTSQTMRMMGTYKDDYGIANRTDTLIPSGCPGPQGINWHPDVSVTLSETRRGSRTANIMF